MRVLFNDVDEFLTELERERDALKRGIVRVTLSLRRLPNAPVTSLAVVATVACEDGVVRLESPAGHLWGIPNEDEPVKAHAQAMRAAIDAACERLGLEVRAGVIEDDCNERTPRTAAERR